MTNRRSAFTLVELMVVVFLIGALLAIALPSFVNSRTRSQANVCRRNLAKIDMAKEQWAMAYKKGDGDSVAETDLVPEFLRKHPECPAGGTYTMHAIGSNPTCSLGGVHSL
jgi:prepilin-type N-terminal cleavage/methylation domain-containing protein